jgi:predicted signal transduction protein with EAL and GGDEF domain
MKTLTAHVRTVTAPLLMFASACLMLFGAHIPNVYAQTWLPFGGPILTTMVCTCTPAVWLVIVGPPRPAALSYVSGSQAFEYFNMPFATWTLGLYMPGVPTCWMGVAPFCGPVTQGTIMPIVGTSGL